MILIEQSPQDASTYLTSMAQGELKSNIISPMRIRWRKLTLSKLCTG